jgi:transcriptional regulator with XRE-family HTH domain
MKQMERLITNDRKICREPKFRDTKNLMVHNKFILALLYAFDYKTIELANYCGVSHTTIENWIYGKEGRGVYPNPVNRKKLIFYFGVDEEFLFGSYSKAHSRGIRRVQREQSKYLRLTANNHNHIDKPLLYGLIWVYRLSTKTMGEELGLKHYLMSKILYTEYEPKLNIKVRFEELFDIPHRILFNKSYRAGGAHTKK